MPTPSVHASDSFNAEQDAKALHKAMKGVGTNEQAIIDVLCHRSADQRQEIVSTFKTAYGSDLDSKLKSELRGNFERLMVALVTPPAEFLAKELHEAMDGIGTKEKTLVEILCSRSNSEMQQIRDAYRKLFDTEIENDIKGDTSGPLRKLLIALLQGERDERRFLNEDQATEDANRLFEAGEGQLGTDESEFVLVLATRSHLHIRKVCDVYKELRGHSLKKAIKAEFSGQTKTAMIAILTCARSTPAYFAKCFEKVMAGLGTRDGDLIRLVVNRCDIDLVDVREEFESKYEKSLADTIARETSGDYKNALLALIG